MQIILNYFPALTEIQKKQFAQLQALYTEWNAMINVISRKDIDELYTRHVLHSLAIAKIIKFAPKSSILDVGTGGGFPGIPLAILFPEVNFHLIDSIGKKIKVVQEVAGALDLKNVIAEKARAQDVKQKYDFVLSRAVCRLVEFLPWVLDNFNRNQINELANGIIYLKGGDLKEELSEINAPATIYPIKEFFTEDFFETKSIVYIPMS